MAAELKAAQNERWEKQYPYKVGKKKVYMTPSAAETQGLVRADKHPKSTRYGRQNPISERFMLLSAKQETSRLFGEDAENRQARQMIMRRRSTEQLKRSHLKTDRCKIER